MHQSVSAQRSVRGSVAYGLGRTALSPRCSVGFMKQGRCGSGLHTLESCSSVQVPLRPSPPVRMLTCLRTCRCGRSRPRRTRPGPGPRPAAASPPQTQRPACARTCTTPRQSLASHHAYITPPGLVLLGQTCEPLPGLDMYQAKSFEWAENSRKTATCHASPFTTYSLLPHVAFEHSDAWSLQPSRLYSSTSWSMIATPRRLPFPPPPFHPPRRPPPRKPTCIEPTHSGRLTSTLSPWRRCSSAPTCCASMRMPRAAT